jgi:murein DD-endopeptidase MepM/ murein hydrolase activator NlpD
MYIPAKHRLLYVMANRYVFHVAIVSIAALVSTLNVQGNEVRAETFGERSLLFSLVNQDDSVVVEEVSAVRGQDTVASSYLGGYVVSADDVPDLDLLDQEYVATTLGGSVLLAPTIADKTPQAAARTDVETYLVQEGDTLGAIAETYALNLSTVLWANDLTFRSTIRPGQTLKIPPVDGVLYMVKNGDTVHGIAKKYQADAASMVAFNKLADANDLQIGETLLIPGGEPPRAPAARRTAPLSSIFTAPSGVNAGSEAQDGWVWPTDWRVITQYYGWRHTGLDIDGDYNTQNYAARAGTVTRAGWFAGYGICVDIDHGDGYLTRYGHFSKLYVNVGDSVGAGQALGKTGTTGRSTGTHLHFEVYENGKRRNPLEFIR